jgi:IS30 family transposase
MHSNNDNNKFKIEERRKEVASMLAQSMTETEIAEKLNVDQSTISRDVKALKEMSQQFVFDLAKSDLSYYYEQSIDGIEEAKKEAWRIHKDNNTYLNTFFFNLSTSSQTEKWFCGWNLVALIISC